MSGPGGNFAVGDKAEATIVRGDDRPVFDGIVLDFHGLDASMLGVGGHFIVECYGPDGELKWEDTAENSVTGVGLNSLMNVYLGAATQITAWYIGLVDNAGFVSFSSTDTAASHSGWSEVAGANYSNSTRVLWTPGSASAGSVVNGSTADHNMINGSSLTVKGLFLISDNTKGGTTGTLFSTAAFTGGNQAVNNGDTLKVTYTVGATSS